MVRYQHPMYTRSLGPKRKIGEEERHYEKELERVLRMKYLRVVEENQRSRGMKDQARERRKLKLHRSGLAKKALMKKVRRRRARMTSSWMYWMYWMVGERPTWRATTRRR